MDNQNPMTVSEWFTLLVFCACIFIVGFALVGVDVIHFLGNILRWLGWA